MPEEISGDFLKFMFRIVGAELPGKSEREISACLAYSRNAAASALGCAPHINAPLQPFERKGERAAYLSKMSIIWVFARGEIFALCKGALAQSMRGMDRLPTI